LHVLLQVLLAGEDPGALQHQVDPEIGPRQVPRVRLGEGRDPLAVDDQRAVFRADLALVTPVDGVVFEQVDQVTSVGDVVNGDDVEPAGVQQDLQRGPADSAQTVDRDGRHLMSPPRVVSSPRADAGRSAGSRRDGSVLLLTATRDIEHSQAAVLAERLRSEG
jgi:hypothetical protein